MKLCSQMKNHDVYTIVISKIRHFFELDLGKTCFYRLILILSSKAKINVYHNSILKIGQKAKVIVHSGTLSINDSWMPMIRRANVSELILRNSSKLEIMAGLSLFQGASLYLGEGAELTVQGPCIINTNSQINCFRSIHIGVGVLISDDVRIQDSDNHIIIESGIAKKKEKPIWIGDRVWIGKSSIILKGVTIGNGSIIAAGSVVTHDIPEACLAAGNPARIICENVTWQA